MMRCLTQKAILIEKAACPVIASKQSWQRQRNSFLLSLLMKSPPWARDCELGTGILLPKSHRQVRPMFATLPACVISLPFNQEKKRETRILVMLIDGALIQLTQLYRVMILQVWFKTGKSSFETRFGKFKASLPTAPAKHFKLAAFLSLSRVCFHHCCCPVSGSSEWPKFCLYHFL